MTRRWGEAARPGCPFGWGTGDRHGPALDPTILVAPSKPWITAKQVHRALSPRGKEVAQSNTETEECLIKGLWGRAKGTPKRQCCTPRLATGWGCGNPKAYSSRGGSRLQSPGRG